MTDIVERLRLSWATDMSIISQTDKWMRERREAADEITHLRKVADVLSTELTMAEEELACAEDEITRLNTQMRELEDKT